jgi:triosephosphate isomerase (TIM)
MLKTPCIIVNLKTYQQGFGKKGLELLKALEKASTGYQGQVAVAAATVDIKLFSEKSALPVFAQHIDPVGFGAFTGHVLPEAVKEAGATGTLINHAERRLTIADIGAAVSRCREVGLISCVCTNNVDTSAAVAALGPDFLAVEPPELIGGNVSVSSAKPEIISGSVQRVRKVNDKVKVLCGAGVKNGKDVSKALELGSAGVLLASGVVTAKDVGAVMKDLLLGLQ